jgi:hypothetical protein
LDRPSGYELASSVLFVFDSLAHLAVALACGIGPAGIAILVIGYFMAGRAARAFAEKRVRSEVRDRFERNAQDWSAEKRHQVADLMAERQIKGLGDGL